MKGATHILTHFEEEKQKKTQRLGFLQNRNKTDL